MGTLHNSLTAGESIHLHKAASTALQTPFGIASLQPTRSMRYVIEANSPPRPRQAGYLPPGD